MAFFSYWGMGLFPNFYIFHVLFRDLGKPIQSFLRERTSGERMVEDGSRVPEILKEIPLRPGDGFRDFFDIIFGMFAFGYRGSELVVDSRIHDGANGFKYLGRVGIFSTKRSVFLRSLFDIQSEIVHGPFAYEPYDHLVVMSVRIEFHEESESSYFSNEFGKVLMHRRFPSANGYAVEFPLSGLEKPEKRLFRNERIGHSLDPFGQYEFWIVAVSAAQSASGQKNDTSRFPRVVDESEFLNAGNDHGKMVSEIRLGIKTDLRGKRFDEFRVGAPAFVEVLPGIEFGFFPLVELAYRTVVAHDAGVDFATGALDFVALRVEEGFVHGRVGLGGR
jgi:hypothetical protein